MTNFTDVCSLDEIPEDEGFKVPGDLDVALFRIGAEVFATQDTCTHDIASLAEGWLEDGVIECPFHSAKFCVRTGKVLCSPATKDLQTFPVKIDSGRVLVDLSMAETSA